MLEQKELKRVVHYDPMTGVFTRKVTLSDGYPKGTETGCVIGTGYLSIMIHKKSYLAHRLAYLYMTGAFPEHQIDHHDHDRTNNKWGNITAATNQENQRNAGLRSDNKSGVPGVWWNKSAGKWQVYINPGKQQEHHGLYPDFFEAVCKRKSLESKYGFHINHGKPVAAHNRST